MFNIAIDGPAGAGKSTIARRVAKALSYIYVDTGAMYRAMALYLIRQGISPQDERAIQEACASARISIAYVDGEQQVLLNDENVTPYLRQEAVGNMVELQQQLAARENVVMDGRDIGTQVLPEAQVKIYLTASARTRARRRFLELEQKGLTADLKQIEEDINQQDYQDMHREISPLRQAEDAVLVDSSDMTIDEVVEAILSLCRERGV